MERIARPIVGLLGGTFNPMHFGHLRMAQELAESLQLDEVRFIPSANPPHKTAPTVSALHRAEMVKLGIASNPIFKFDDRELRRTGPSYMVDTLQSLRDELGAQASLILFMGSDAFTEFNTWHRWEEIIGLCHIVLAQRPLAAKIEPLSRTLDTFLHNHYTENAEDLRESSAGYVTMQAITPLDISSTAIRQHLQSKKSARYLMPDDVIGYIQSHHLYGAKGA